MNEIARIGGQPGLVSRSLTYDPEAFGLVDIISQMLLIQLLRMTNVGARPQQPEQNRLYGGSGKYGCTLPFLGPEIDPRCSDVLLNIRPGSAVMYEG